MSQFQNKMRSNITRRVLLGIIIIDVTHLSMEKYLNIMNDREQLNGMNPSIQRVKVSEKLRER